MTFWWKIVINSNESLFDEAVRRWIVSKKKTLERFPQPIWVYFSCKIFDFCSDFNHYFFVFLFRNSMHGSIQAIIAVHSTLMKMFREIVCLREISRKKVWWLKTQKKKCHIFTYVGQYVRSACNTRIPNSMCDILDFVLFPRHIRNERLNKNYLLKNIKFSY